MARSLPRVASQNYCENLLDRFVELAVLLELRSHAKRGNQFRLHHRYLGQ
jgi:hypothetical protein